MEGIETVERALRDAEANYQRAVDELNHARESLRRATLRHDRAMHAKVWAGLEVDRAHCLLRSHQKP